MWSTRYRTHIQALQYLPVIGDKEFQIFQSSQVSFFLSYQLGFFFVFSFSYIFPFFVSSFHDQEGSMHLLTRLIPMLTSTPAGSTYSTAQVSLLVQTKVSLQYKLNALYRTDCPNPLCGVLLCTLRLIISLLSFPFFQLSDLNSQGKLITLLLFSGLHPGGAHLSFTVAHWTQDSSWDPAALTRVERLLAMSHHAEVLLCSACLFHVHLSLLPHFLTSPRIFNWCSAVGSFSLLEDGYFCLHTVPGPLS